MRILCFVAVQAGSDAVGVLVPDRPAGHGTRIRVDASFESEPVDVVCHAFHAAGKPCGMWLHHSIGISVTEETVVNIYIGVTGISEAKLHHRVGLTLDECVADMDSIGVPRTPTHDGCGTLGFGWNGSQQHERC